MTERELKSCPFCGSRSARAVSAISEEYQHSAVCLDCGGGVFVPGSQPFTDAIAAWNRRSPAPLERGWREIASAPIGDGVIVAARWENGETVVGEAHRVEGEWWWAQQWPGEDGVLPIERSGCTVIGFQPLPEAPHVL